MKLAQVREHIDVFHGPPLQMLSSCLRGFLIAGEGLDLIAADFSAIEARVLAWLSGEEKVLEIFRSHGKIYEATAADIYSVPIEKVTKEQRQIGKVAILSLGYGGGVGAFQMMAPNYGVKVADKLAEIIKVKWREAHSNIVRYWYELEGMAKAAISNPGKVFEAGPPGRQVKYKTSGSFLFCLLPSGRANCYPYPKIQPVETPWGEMRDGITFMGEDSFSHKWERMKTYGGSLAENVTQAVARDLLAEAMLRLEANSFPIVMHVHDEIVSEVPEEYDSEALPKFMEIMFQNPSWAEGLPISGEGFRAKRYQK